MNVDGKNMRPIWLEETSGNVKIIDQRKLPHEFVIVELTTPEAVITAIREMYVRGAPLIGATAAYGVYLAARECMHESAFDNALSRACRDIRSARPTAVNLAWAVDRMQASIGESGTVLEKVARARQEAGRITEEEADNCRRIGEHGLKLIEAAVRKKGGGPSIF